jgi:hypothetical protein
MYADFNTYAPIEDPMLQPKVVCRKRYGLYAAGTFFLLTCGFLMWEHFEYKDVSPPHEIAILRDISVVLLTLSFISIIAITSYIIVKKYNDNQQDFKWNVFMVFGFTLYLASGFFSLYVEYYYSWGSNTHSMPSSVEILNYISLGYFAIVTIIIVLVALSHSPIVPVCVLCFSV